MSASSSIINSLRHQNTAGTLKDTEHTISLIDTERIREQDIGPQNEGTEQSDSEATTAPPTPGGITKKLTRHGSQLQQSLKKEYQKRKYAKYSLDRYDTSQLEPPDEDPANQPQQGEAALPTQTSYLERATAKASKAKNNLLKRKRTLGKGTDDRESVLDILYENQRGWFFFGVPKYSSSSLLPNDPNAWQNAHLKASPVDIRNAQVPDPSWEWSWKSWYVDMSRDVDEEGWEYSLKFRGGFAWHGNHPWFHSFVRRRRWVRLRKKKEAHRHVTREKAHEFTADYFTIHPKKTVKAPSEMLGSGAGSSGMARLDEKMPEESDVEKVEIADIGSLIRAMRRAAVDREKLVAVKKFVREGGEELYYLSDRMPEIMGMFVFQSSRRQLLSELLLHSSGAKEPRESLTEHKHDDDKAQKEHDTASRNAENLMRAVTAADAQIKRLEYWSDIKGMAHGGETLQETSHSHWDLSKWQGLSPSGEGPHAEEAFVSKQDASEGVRDLHSHPEHEGKNADEQKPAAQAEETLNKGVVRAEESETFFDAQQTAQRSNGKGKGKESSTDDQRSQYTTAPEYASQSQGLFNRTNSKSKRGVTNLDGIEEFAQQTNFDEFEASEGGTSQAHLPGMNVSSPRNKSVQIVEPVPEPTDDREVGDRGGGGDGS